MKCHFKIAKLCTTKWQRTGCIFESCAGLSKILWLPPSILWIMTITYRCKVFVGIQHPIPQRCKLISLSQIISAFVHQFTNEHKMFPLIWSNNCFFLLLKAVNRKLVLNTNEIVCFINWVDNVNWPQYRVSKLTFRALALIRSDEGLTLATSA